MSRRTPRFLDLVPLLVCRDVQASVRFYERVLGFEVLSRDDDVGGSGFATVGRGAGRVMLASPTYLPRARRVEGKFPQSALRGAVTAGVSSSGRPPVAGEASTAPRS